MVRIQIIPAIVDGEVVYEAWRTKTKFRLFSQSITVRDERVEWYWNNGTIEIASSWGSRKHLYYNTSDIACLKLILDKLYGRNYYLSVWRP